MMTLSSKRSNYLRELEAQFSWHSDQLAYHRQSITIRPVSAEDCGLLYAMHRGLSRDSLYSRYLRVHTPTPAEMAYVSQLRGNAGAGFVATVEAPSEQVVGLAYYVTDSEKAQAADFALVVADSYQNQGIGTRLFQRLYRHARRQGITHFEGSVKADNRPMLHLLKRSGLAMTSRLAHGAREVSLTLPQLSES